MAEYIFEIDDALVNEGTGEAVMKPTYKGKIVRCKDCTYFRHTSFFGMKATMCDWFEKLIDEDAFCSNGNRRSEDE